MFIAVYRHDLLVILGCHLVTTNSDIIDAFIKN